MKSTNEIFTNRINSFINGDITLLKKIISIYIYGSVATGETNKKSDIDCYIVATEIDMALLKTIKEIKKKLETEIKREIFINILPFEDFKKENFENDLFSHRERPYVFLFQLKNNFKLIYGKDLANVISYPSDFEKNLKKECIKLIRNFRYIDYKLIVNNVTKLYSRDTIFKNVLFSSKVFEIFINNNFKNFKESTSFTANYLGDELPKIIYNNIKKAKNNNYNEKKKIIGKTINFYNHMLDTMQNKILFPDLINGYYDYHNFRVYYSFRQDKLNKGGIMPAIMYLNGMPRPSKIKDLAEYFVDKGFIFLNIYYPGYHGTDGLLNFSALPKQINLLAKNIYKHHFKDFFSNKLICPKINKLYVIGSSFGGSLTLNIDDNLFEKKIAISPLIDFKTHKKIIDDLFVYLKDMKESIHIDHVGTNAKNNFYTLDPLRNESASSVKSIIIADKKDPQIYYSTLKKYSDDNGIVLLTTNQNRHGYKILQNNRIMKKLMTLLHN